ncbi:MAG: glycoside hydrolase family 20 zincin-like fold domain-containing protein, partial [Myxococcaceae bacterium]
MRFALAVAAAFAAASCTPQPVNDVEPWDRLIPQPRTVSPASSGSFVFGPNARVSTCHEALQPTADRLVARLREVTGFAWKQVADAPEVELRLCLDSGLEREGYTLSVTKSGVAIFGGDAPGVERAVQTFWQLLPVSPPRGA